MITAWVEKQFLLLTYDIWTTYRTIICFFVSSVQLMWKLFYKETMRYSYVSNLYLRLLVFLYKILHNFFSPIQTLWFWFWIEFMWFLLKFLFFFKINSIQVIFDNILLLHWINLNSLKRIFRKQCIVHNLTE